LEEVGGGRESMRSSLETVDTQRQQDACGQLDVVRSTAVKKPGQITKVVAKEGKDNKYTFILSEI
jgi:hypothetical protein